MSAAAEEDVELYTWGGYVSKRLLQVLLRLYRAICNHNQNLPDGGPNLLKQLLT